MLYLTESLEITKDRNALYQVSIPRHWNCIPEFYVNKGDKSATKVDKEKIIKVLTTKGLLYKSSLNDRYWFN